MEREQLSESSILKWQLSSDRFPINRWDFVCFLTGKKLFGEGYSGLEYDYRGLIKLYNSVGNYEKVFEYNNVLSNWNRLRDRQFAVADALEDVNTTPQQTQEVVQAFLLAQSLGPTRPCLG